MEAAWVGLAGFGPLSLAVLALCCKKRASVRKGGDAPSETSCPAERELTLGPGASRKASNTAASRATSATPATSTATATANSRPFTLAEADLSGLPNSAFLKGNVQEGSPPAASA